MDRPAVYSQYFPDGLDLELIDLEQYMKGN